LLIFKRGVYAIGLLSFPHIVISWRFISLFSPNTLILPQFLPLLLCASLSFGAETVIVNKTFDGKEIKLKTGGLIRIELEELGSAGYAWTIQGLDREHLEIVSVQTEPLPHAKDITGAPVIRTWLIRGTKEGKSELKFLYYRPWEGERNAADEFVFRLRIF
jgi:predicted secreted protein